jgi:hypothetical protein
VRAEIADRIVVTSGSSGASSEARAAAWESTLGGAHAG